MKSGIRAAIPSGFDSFAGLDKTCGIDEGKVVKAEDAWYEYLSFAGTIESGDASAETAKEISEGFDKAAGADSWAYSELFMAEDALARDPEPETQVQTESAPEIIEPVDPEPETQGRQETSEPETQEQTEPSIIIETEPQNPETEGGTESEIQIETEKQSEQESEMQSEQESEGQSVQESEKQSEQQADDGKRFDK